MKIDKILSQHRRDFTARYRCQHCNATTEGRGYDDDNFHRNVIPDMACESCGLRADPETYRPMGTKHPAGKVL